MRRVTASGKQTIWDISLQAMGTGDSVFEILALNPDLSPDTDIEEGTEVLLPNLPTKPMMVAKYNENNIRPATGDTDDLLIYTENDGGMITKTYNYPLTSGDKTFDGVRLYNLNKDVTVQINYSGIDADDVQVVLESSLDGVSYTQIMEASFVLDKTKPMHTFTILGLVTSYVRLRVIVGSATAGTIDEMIILV